MSLRSFKYDGSRITYELKGRGYPIVWLHGALTDHRKVSRFLRELVKSGFQAVIPDLPGHGRTEFWSPRVSRIVDSLEALMTEIGAERYGCIGHSMGAILASELGVRDSRMERCILLVPVVSKRQALDFNLGCAWECLKRGKIRPSDYFRTTYSSLTYPDHSEKRVEARVEEIMSQGWRAFLSAPFWAINTHMDENIRKMGERCLVVAGKGDRIAPPEFAAEVTDNIVYIPSNHSNIDEKDLGKGRDNLFVKFFNGGSPGRK